MGKYNGFARAPMPLGIALALAISGCASTPEPVAPEAQPAQPVFVPAPPPAAEPQPVTLRRAAPLKYVVKKGDTLWDIAAHFIRDPWQWPEVWVVNRQVKNPHLIYPGDVLELRWRDGRPQVVRTESAVERMSPQIREIPLDQAVPAIPIDAIRNFLRGPRLVTPQELEAAPVIVAFDEDRVVAASGSDIYVTGLKREEFLAYTVIHVGEPYVDPDDGKLLGYEAIPQAEAEVKDYGGEVATLELVESFRETRIGSRLLPISAEDFQANFFPHAPAKPVNGKIISVFDGVSQIGQYQIVAINRGALDGMEPGHVLSIFQRGRRVKDPVNGGVVQLPDQYAGMLMVFKVAGELSYGLVMSAERAIHVLDRVDKPRPSN